MLRRERQGPHRRQCLRSPLSALTLVAGDLWGILALAKSLTLNLPRVALLCSLE